MKILQRLSNAWNAFRNDTAELNEEKLLEWLGIAKGIGRNQLSEVTYFTCLKMLSETMGKLPLKYYQETREGRKHADLTDTAYILSVRPNEYMTASTMWTTVEMNCQHFGDGYVWIRKKLVRDKYGGRLKAVDAWPLQSNYVQTIIDNAGAFGDNGFLYHIYNDPRTGKAYVLNDSDTIHVKTWYSFDGFKGVPVRDILKLTIDGAAESQTFMNNLYKQGLTASMALQYPTELGDGERKMLEKKYANALTGSENAGKIIPVPIGLKLEPLKMNLTDAQFFELKKYSSLQIAGAFGIKPNQINNYEKSSYANSESQQLAFLVETMSYRLKEYEEEINAKGVEKELAKKGFHYKFNEKAILRVNTKDQMESLTKAVNNGIYTANEARGFLDVQSQKGGDILMVNGNYIPITDVGKQYKTNNEGGEGDGTS